MNPGIDFTKSLPSRVQMLGLVFKPNVRDALAKVAAGLQEAGVNPQVECLPTVLVVPPDACYRRCRMIL